jgi:UDP-N-acetylmuramoyl-L-alanyl-D-glutamate--2,6-diaminopimelate ligase
MGRVAERYADVVFVTSDNPRSEPPEQIAQAILSGMVRPDLARLILDRQEAIQSALKELGEGDALLIAGKGHERTQVVAGEVRLFNDLAACKSACEI